MGLLFAAAALVARNDAALARERHRSIVGDRPRYAEPTDPRNPASPMHRESALTVSAPATGTNRPRASVPGSVRRRMEREARAAAAAEGGNDAA